MSPLSDGSCLLKKIAMFVLCSAVLMAFAQPSKAQNVTQAPASLTFGIPTGTSPAISAAQTVTLAINLAAEVNLSFSNPSATITGANASSFSILGNSCTGQYTGPFTGTCQVAVAFNSPSTTLQTASLQISGSGFELPAVPLSGAFGAIKILDATTDQASFNGPTFTTNFYTIGTAKLNLSCPGAPTATLSYTPDGLGYVLVDNYITLAINGSPVTTYVGSFNGGPPTYSAVYTNPNNGLGFAQPPGNVCQGSDAFPDQNDLGYYPECFSAAYRGAVTNLVGANGDSIVFPGNTNAFLNGAAAGIPPLNIASLFPTSESTQQVQATISLVDGGGYAASSTVFLVTNCSLNSVAPGGAVTGNPITANPATQTQTFNLNSGPGENISFTTSDAVAIANGAPVPTNATPVVQDFGISQTQFLALVANSSAAPSACLLISGEVDPVSGKTLCKGFQLQCFSGGTLSGDNCGSSMQRFLLDSAQFSSPDTPFPPTLQTTLVNSCASYMQNVYGKAGGTCVQSSSPGLNPTTLIGPGFLMFGDSTTGPQCTPGLSGELTGNLCPLDTLTAFKGAADPLPTGGSAPTRNTIYVPVVNMPLPFTTFITSPALVNGWFNSTTPIVKFTSHEATYSPTLGSNPPANGWNPAPPYSFTYGLALASQPIPDTTYPVPTDTTAYNAGVNHGYVAPICPGISVQNPPPSSFETDVPLTLTDGSSYNLHYFTTDCAYTEELLFHPSMSQLTDPTANWASFPVLSFSVDTVTPSIAASYPSGNSFTLNQANATVQYTCSDDLSGINTCGGLPPQGQNACPSAPNAGAGVSPASVVTTANLNVGSSNIGQNTFTAYVYDCAGNSSSTNVSYTVTAPPATAAIVALPATAHPNKTLTYLVFAADLSPAANPSTIYNGTITATFQLPASTLASGNATGIYADIVCTTLPCGITPAGGKACAVMPSAVTSSTPSVSVTCPVGIIGDLFASRTAVGVKITLPISANPPVGNSISVTGSISAGPYQQLSGITSFRATVPIKSSEE
jgi:hypothetical protein